MLAAGSSFLSVAPEIAKKAAEIDFPRAVFLGSGSHYGTAIESHLKLQELTNGQVMCSYNTFLDLRHGPKAVINDQTLVVAYLASDRYVNPYEIHKPNSPSTTGVIHRVVQGVKIYNPKVFAEKGVFQEIPG